MLEQNIYFSTPQVPPIEVSGAKNRFFFFNQTDELLKRFKHLRKFFQLMTRKPQLIKENIDKNLINNTKTQHRSGIDLNSKPAKFELGGVL